MAEDATPQPEKHSRRYGPLRRYLLGTLLLSLISPGAGYVVPGLYHRLIAAWVVWAGAWVFLMFALLYDPLGGVGGWFGVGVLGLVYAGVLVDTVRQLLHHRAQPLMARNRWPMMWGAVVALLVLNLLCTRALQFTVTRNFNVNGDAMMPTLLPGDRVLVDLLADDTGSIQRGQIIMYRRPEGPEVVMVSRVVGLPGETITVRDGTVNISPLPRPRLRPVFHWWLNLEDKPVPDRLLNVPGVALGPDEFYVIGDRLHAIDSRTFGPVTEQDIIGSAKVVFFSRVPPQPVPLLRKWNPIDLPGDIRWDRINTRLDPW